MTSIGVDGARTDAWPCKKVDCFKNDPLPVELKGPSRLRVPDGVLGYLLHHRDFLGAERAFESATGDFKRSWMVKHAYHCLPLVMGSQVGISVRTLIPFSARWEGGDQPADVKVEVPKSPLQSVEAHFGIGTFTVQFRVTLRTAPGINLLVMPPSNRPKDGVWPLTALVETDNLRRDFTYTLRLTRPRFTVRYGAGEVLATLLPINRGVPESLHLQDLRKLVSEDILVEELEAQQFATFHRQVIEPKAPGGVGRLYWKGMDSYGNAFPSHQSKLACPYSGAGAPGAEQGQ